MNITLSVIWLIVGYIVVTLVGILHTVFNWKVLKIENESKEIKSMYDITSYSKTVPYHPLYNIILWPIFAYFYLSQVGNESIWMEAFIIGTTWCLVTIIIDFFAWVLIKHSWSMSFKEMYLDYQPWITLIYISIFISPFIAVLITL